MGGTGTICDGPNPVMMSSFTSSVNKNNVKLNWTTEFELNNSGFDIERQLVGQTFLSDWTKIAFVQGHGTT